VLIINAPGNMQDAFFTTIGQRLPQGRTDLPTPCEPDIPAVMAAAEDVGMTILTPAEAPA
jgi:hypothetical protein